MVDCETEGVRFCRCGAVKDGGLLWGRDRRSRQIKYLVPHPCITHEMLCEVL